METARKQQVFVIQVQKRKWGEKKINNNNN